MLAIGAGGLDVACAMGGSPYYFPLPRVVQVVLTGRLRPWVAAKDVILELLRRLTVRGGFGKIFEYAGPGVATLTVPQRATIANMGAELGLTTSIFPSDEVTRSYLARLGRDATWRPLAADPDAATTTRSRSTSRRSSPSWRCPDPRTMSSRSARSRAPPSSRSWSARAPTARGRTCPSSPRSCADSASTRTSRSFSFPRASRSSRRWRARASWRTSSRRGRSSPSRPAARAPASAMSRRPAPGASEPSTGTFPGAAESRATRSTSPPPRRRAPPPCAA